MPVLELPVVGVHSEFLNLSDCVDHLDGGDGDGDDGEAGNGCVMVTVMMMISGRPRASTALEPELLSSHALNLTEKFSPVILISQGCVRKFRLAPD